MRPGNPRGFKSCPRVGGIKPWERRESVHIAVSSRAPVWGASIEKYRCVSDKMFQVVPPCGGHP